MSILTLSLLALSATVPNVVEARGGHGGARGGGARGGGSRGGGFKSGGSKSGSSSKTPKSGGSGSKSGGSKSNGGTSKTGGSNSGKSTGSGSGSSGSTSTPKPYTPSKADPKPHVGKRVETKSGSTADSKLNSDKAKSSSYPTYKGSYFYPRTGFRSGGSNQQEDKDRKPYYSTNNYYYGGSRFGSNSFVENLLWYNLLFNGSNHNTYNSYNSYQTPLSTPTWSAPSIVSQPQQKSEDQVTQSKGYLDWQKIGKIIMGVAVVGALITGALWVLYKVMGN